MDVPGIVAAGLRPVRGGRLQAGPSRGGVLQLKPMSRGIIMNRLNGR
jgi:hypothetical protein